MGLDIFFDEDIRNALLAADEASSSTAKVCATVGRDGRDESTTRLYLRAYLEGYRAAMTTVALAFGLSPDIIGGRDPSSCSSTGPGQRSGQGETLEAEARTVGEVLLSSE